jgi:hypothetical protein
MCAGRFSRRIYRVGNASSEPVRSKANLSEVSHEGSYLSLASDLSLGSDLSLVAGALMKGRIYRSRFLSPSLAVSVVALFVALGGGAAYAASQFANNAGHLGGKAPSYYLASKHFVSSGGEKFLSVGQTKVLGHAGHFTFSATCTNSSGTPGAQQVTFDVTANTTSDLDGTGPVTAGNSVNIHTNSDKLDSNPPDATLNPGDFDQVGSASSSTEIAADGQEVDIFYNDGVNWAVDGGASHDCFAGYTGFLG